MIFVFCRRERVFFKMVSNALTWLGDRGKP